MKEIIIDILVRELKLKKEKIEEIIEIPPSPELGDYAFPCFVLAKKLKKNPEEIAKELAKKIKRTKEISEIKSVGPYLNFFINKKILAGKILKGILKKKKIKTKKEKIVLEFLSPNTNKPLHLGHLRNISIGESISRILEQDSKVIRTNLYNDRGIHIAKSMLAYQKFGKNKNPNKKSDHFVGDFYVLFNEKLKENPELEQEAQEMLGKWEKGDKKTLELWKKMNSWAIKGIEQTYKKFDIKFDKQYSESQIYKKAREIINDGLKKGLFKIRKDNAIVIDLGKELGEKVLLRADGTSIYITQDLYLAKKRYQDFKYDKLIYVVGNEQNYHFKILFKILKLLKYKFSDKLKHLSYGMVFLPEGRMKSREGIIVDADDLILEMEKLAEEELKKRYKLNKKELESRTKKISLASIKYFFLKIDLEKDITFEPEKAIDFEGNTGPYLQYSYARASSILKKSKKKLNIKFRVIDLKQQEINLIKKLSEFPQIIEKAKERLNPSIIANYSFELSQQFNEFYHASKVIGSKEEPFRLALVKSFRQIIKEALYLLEIETMEEM